MTLAEAIFSFTRDDMRVEWLDAPGKSDFLRFARVSMRFLTLANIRFCYLPGVIRGYTTLAKATFSILPGVIRG